MLSRGEPITGCMTRKPNVASFQRTWLQNASSQFIECLKREFSLKIHSSRVTCTQKSSHPLLQQLTGPKLMPWIELTFFFFPLKSELLLGKQRRGFIFFWHSHSRENTRLLQVAMCSVVANIMASPLQREKGKSKTGQDWAPPMCCVTAATTTRPAETGDTGKPLVWSAVLFSTTISLKCMSNTMLKCNMD